MKGLYDRPWNDGVVHELMDKMEDIMEEKKKTSRDIKGQAINLKDMVDYQAGSVVSREIIKKQTGNVTFFAFDQDQGLSEHKAPFDALVHVLEGEVEISISGKPHRLQEGETIIMPGGKPHALKAIKRFKMMLVMIRS